MAKKEELSRFERLGKVQDELNAPKNLYNKFGQYYYRNAEGIIDAAKPLLAKYDLMMKIHDVLEAVEGKVFISAVVTIRDRKDGSLVEEGKASARHADAKKGMDDSQVTGSTSSYARKYALNGVFLIDDVKDADATNTHGKEDKPTKGKKKAKAAKPDTADNGVEGLW